MPFWQMCLCWLRGTSFHRKRRVFRTDVPRSQHTDTMVSHFDFLPRRCAQGRQQSSGEVSAQRLKEPFRGKTTLSLDEGLPLIREVKRTNGRPKPIASHSAEKAGSSQQGPTCMMTQA